MGMWWWSWIKCQVNKSNWALSSAIMNVCTELPDQPSYICWVFLFFNLTNQHCNPSNHNTCRQNQISIYLCVSIMTCPSLCPCACSALGRNYNIATKMFHHWCQTQIMSLVWQMQLQIQLTAALHTRDARRGDKTLEAFLDEKSVMPEDTSIAPSPSQPIKCFKTAELGNTTKQLCGCDSTIK